MSNPGDAGPSDPNASQQAVQSSPFEGLPTEESRIIIRPDGQVVIENLTALLAEVAIELDPAAELACRIELDSPADEPDPDH